VTAGDFVGIYAALLSTVVAVISGIRWWQARRPRVLLRAIPTGSGIIYMEAINLGERAIYLAGCSVEQEGTVAGGSSPYPLSPKDPDPLEPGQMHSWHISLENTQLDHDRPIHISVRLATGQIFRAEPVWVASS